MPHAAVLRIQFGTGRAGVSSTSIRSSTSSTPGVPISWGQSTQGSPSTSFTRFMRAFHHAFNDAREVVEVVLAPSEVAVLSWLCAGILGTAPAGAHATSRTRTRADRASI